MRFLKYIQVTEHSAKAGTIVLIMNLVFDSSADNFITLTQHGTACGFLTKSSMIYNLQRKYILFARVLYVYIYVERENLIYILNFKKPRF